MASSLARQQSSVTYVDQPDSYERWNEAIAEQIFSVDAAFKPVYLDLDEELLGRIAAETGVALKSAAEELGSAVRATLDLRPGNLRLFRWHEQRIAQWMMDPNLETRTPPHIALLAALSLAAERMGRDEQSAPNNYYGRLCDVFGLPRSDANRLGSAYRRVARALWGALERWLEANEHLRGVPSAYSLGKHAYIGLPISQALVRSDDRQRFSDLFERSELTPGQALTADDMERLIDDWAQQPDSDASHLFRTMWKRADLSLRSRIADVATVELASWQGVSSGSSSSAYRHARLVALLRSFPTPRIEITLAVPATGHSRDFAVLGPEGDEQADIRFESLWPGWMAAAPDQSIEVGSLLTRVARLRDSEDKAEYLHEPRGLYVLTTDEMAQALVERERVALGTDTLILAVRRLRTDLLVALGEIARPGYVIFADEHLAGLPPEWMAISSLQVMAVPSAIDKLDKELAALIPAVATQLVLGGGFSLPGRPSRWSSLMPPEIRAVAAAAESLAVEIRDLDTVVQAQPRLRFDAVGSALVGDLTSAQLPNGDYEVLLFRNGHSEPVQRQMLRLRSADQPLDVSSLPPLGHDSSALAAITAIEGPFSRPPIVGAFVQELGDLPSTGPGKRLGSAKWLRGDCRGQDDRLVSRPIDLAAAGGVACLISGSHRWLIPEAAGRRTVVGSCMNCGLRRSYPATWGRLVWSQSRHRRKRAAHEDLRDLPEVTRNRSAEAAALDSLFFLGGGGAAEFDHVARQIEEGALFGRTYSLSLDGLGELEFKRDPGDSRIVSWMAGPPTLVGLGRERYILLGRRNGALEGALIELVSSLRGQVEIDSAGGAGGRIHVSGLDRAQMEQVASQVASLGMSRPNVVDNAAEWIAHSLPSLSSVADALHRVQAVHGGGEWSLFDPSCAIWRRVTQPTVPGGYRLQTRVTRYFLRTASDVSRGVMASADVSTVKYVTAIMNGVSLTEYDETTKRFVVPLGAEVPGLYGRALVLSSGRVPRRSIGTNRGKPMIVYGNVSLTTALIVQSRLLS